MLTEEHKDDDYQLSVDEVSALLQAQISSMNKRLGKPGGAQELETLNKWFVERAKSVPMRLTLEERKTLRLVDAFLRGSSYVDRVDVSLHANANKRLNEKLRCIATTFVGLISALDYGKGKELAESFEFAQYAEAFRTMFEIVRRYKIMNPDRLRDSYGKLIMLLQDCCSAEASDMLGFNVVSNIRTVYSVLEEHDALGALQNEWTCTATMEILNDGKMSKLDIRQLIKHKENALETLAVKYAKRGFSKDDVKQCLYSLGDNASYLNSNCKPIDDMLAYLKSHFSPALVGSKFPNRSLAIFGGENGSRLTHSHERQFNYVLQTMTLWREILHEIFRLWTLAETDLLDSSCQYKWRDTGQSFHRLQNSPRISKAMHGILYRVQQSLGEKWVGSNVIHLNDSNVPNALVFIDKWNQVPRILNPIVQTLRKLEQMDESVDSIRGLLESSFGGLEETKVRILHSFFRQGFDGSGGDDWFSAGSCVDARLTSSWNWCQTLAQRDFFFLFKLTGFLGFDGEF